ncbi:uncharacterized protein C1orf21 homolog isoform X2 [Equus asinus]|uniref:uncharacterized protein C1orf21 homolog isoform X2 n=1 Tax=Equus asinus TaxID=9793 RepID=UPI0038F6E4B7
MRLWAVPLPSMLPLFKMKRKPRRGKTTRTEMCLAEKSASSNVRLKTNKEIPGLVHQPRANMHISESQQEFFRMLDEKIEKEDWSPSFSAHKMFYATSTTNLEMTLGSDTLVEITVRKKRISHSTNSPTQTRSYYCVNRLHPS